MVERDLVFAGKLKHTGIFDYKEFYRFCYNWLIDKDYFLVEKEYTEKIQQNGKEVVIKWEARRKISDYFRFFIKADWRILGMKDVEVVKDGNKLTLNKGEAEIKIEATVEKDYEHRWENTSFYKFLRTMYDRYLIRSRIEQYEMKIWGEANEFLSQMKSFLALEGNRQ